MAKGYKYYEVKLLIYKRGEMNSRPLENVVCIWAESPAGARQLALSPHYSSLADSVKIVSLRRI